MARFVNEHAFLRATRAFALLAPHFLHLRALGIRRVFVDGFKLFDEQLAGKKTVEPLVPGGLAFDLHSAGTMEEHDASGRLIHILSAMTAGTDERLLQVSLQNAEGSHALRQLRLLVCRDGGGIAHAWRIWMPLSLRNSDGK